VEVQRMVAHGAQITDPQSDFVTGFTDQWRRRRKHFAVDG